MTTQFLKLNMKRLKLKKRLINLTTRNFKPFDLSMIFKRYGGNSWLVHLYRFWFETKTTLGSMWKGNPILTSLIFGLPAGFLSLIFYGICCPDILDADEEEEGNFITSLVFRVN